MTIHLTKHETKTGCGYFYTVTKDATAWTAFETKHGLKRFLRAYRLTPKFHWRRGKNACFYLQGPEIEFIYAWDKKEFLKCHATIEQFDLSNGSYTLYKYFHLPDKTLVYCLNPNVKDRPESNYFETRTKINLGEKSHGLHLIK